MPPLSAKKMSYQHTGSACIHSTLIGVRAENIMDTRRALLILALDV